MRLGILLLAVICCTDKPDAGPPTPGSADQMTPLSFSGLDGNLKHNEAFAVTVSINDESVGSGDAAQALIIVLSQRAGTGDWQKIGEQAATNNSATFSVTLPAGKYTLKAEVQGKADMSQESKAFTVSTDSPAGSAVALSFSQESHTIKSGALFDVTITVAGSDKLTEGSSVELKLLKDDDSEAGMLMQWKSTKEDMQVPGGAITVEVGDDGKAEFKDLFIVDDKDVAKLQAVLEHAGSSLTAEAEFSSEAGSITFNNVDLYDKGNNCINININPVATKQTSTSIYFFNNNANPVTVHGAHSGSGIMQDVNSDIADLDKYCYDLAIRFIEDKYAFLQRVTLTPGVDDNCKK